MVEGEVVDRWIQRGMLKYSRKLSQGGLLVHECDNILHNVEGGLTSLVLYIPQARRAWEGVQDSCLICNRKPHIH